MNISEQLRQLEGKFFTFSSEQELHVFLIKEIKFDKRFAFLEVYSVNENHISEYAMLLEICLKLLKHGVATNIAGTYTLL